jgi:VIT1/CCC1 family predicted Fe2+/Mn2+ transporter
MIHIFLTCVIALLLLGLLNFILGLIPGVPDYAKRIILIVYLILVVIYLLAGARGF